MMDILPIFRPDYVRRQAVEALHKVAAQINARSVILYRQAVENVEKNWKAFRLMQEMPQVPKALGVDEENLRLVETDELVCEPATPPWEKEAEEPAPEIDIGPEIGPGIFAAGRSIAEPGTQTIIDGKLYELVVIGRPGSLVFQRLWVPKGWKA